MMDSIFENATALMLKAIDDSAKMVPSREDVLDAMTELAQVMSQVRFFIYRYILYESCSQFDLPPSYIIILNCSPLESGATNAERCRRRADRSH